MNIDVHCHLFTPGMLEDLRRETGLSSLRDTAHGVVRTNLGLVLQTTTEEECIADMRRRGIDRQVVSVRTTALFEPADLAANSDRRYALSTVVNDHLAGLCHRHPDRFMAFADVELSDPERGTREMVRCLDKLGLAGVYLLSNVHGKPLDDPQYRDFFAEADRRRAVLFMHPAHPAHMDVFAGYHLYTIVGYPFDTTLAATRLVYSGTAARFPNLRLILSHAGGAIPYLWYRLDTGFVEDWTGCRANIDQPPSHYFKRFYYDTAISFPGALRLAYECIGDHLMLGTDYPYIPADVERTLAAIEQLDAPDEVKRRILGGNAAALLPRGDS